MKNQSGNEFSVTIYDIKVSSLCAQTSHFFRTNCTRIGHFLDMGVWSGTPLIFGVPNPDSVMQIGIKASLLHHILARFEL